MEIKAIDHVYAETTTWTESVAFWQDLGFRFVEQWGSDGHRAGRLEAGDAAIVLAEVETSPQFSVFFDVSDLEDTALPGVLAPLEDTHWGTRWVRVEDPQGRVHALEERP